MAADPLQAQLAQPQALSAVVSPPASRVRLAARENRARQVAPGPLARSQFDEADAPGYSSSVYSTPNAPLTKHRGSLMTDPALIATGQRQNHYPARSKMLDMYVGDIARMLADGRSEGAEQAALAVPHIAVALAHADLQSSPGRIKLGAFDGCTPSSTHLCTRTGGVGVRTASTMAVSRSRHFADWVCGGGRARYPCRCCHQSSRAHPHPSQSLGHCYEPNAIGTSRRAVIRPRCRVTSPVWAFCAEGRPSIARGNGYARTGEGRPASTTNDCSVRAPDRGSFTESIATRSAWSRSRVRLRRT